MERFSKLASSHIQTTPTANRKESEAQNQITQSRNGAAIALFVVFVVLVFGGITALHLYCIYLGVKRFYSGDAETECSDEDFTFFTNKLSGWLITHGILGLISTALLIVTAIPEKKVMATDAEVQRQRNKLLIIPVGIAELLHLVWFLVGSYWIKDTLTYRNLGCSNEITWFSFLYIISLWGVVTLLCTIVCCYAGIRGAMVNHRRLPSDDSDSWQHSISLSEIGGDAARTDEQVQLANA
mmetsp:Transcript_14387/g.18913  ORF Transcript_14387/g.18913 Transcript_14387/m.18913 type:complete len:240 (-) Transcript_14387:74-793(-)